jgi:hypothetical protein
MNTFYGKPLNELQHSELVLLSLDIDIMNGKKNNFVPNEVMKMMYNFRLGLVLKCFQCGGDYSIIRFEREFNGGITEELEEGFEECQVLPDLPMCLN